MKTLFLFLFSYSVDLLANVLYDSICSKQYKLNITNYLEVMKMIKKINEVLKNEDVALEVTELNKDILLCDLERLAGFSVLFMFEDYTYCLELLVLKNEEEIVDKGVYITKDGEYIASYI